MKSPLPVLLMMAASVTLTGAISAQPSNPLPTSPDNVQVITMTAKKYEFNPSPIRVKAGTRVELKITAIDHVHGFSINDMPEGSNQAGLIFSTPRGCQRIEKGQTVTVEFVAKAPGTYPFRCCVHCGWRHRSMKGELIVEP
jgi:cytochrome c oxidase subunit 2